jgi:hypothetical protein
MLPAHRLRALRLPTPGSPWPYVALPVEVRPAVRAGSRRRPGGDAAAEPTRLPERGGADRSELRDARVHDVQHSITIGLLILGMLTPTVIPITGGPARLWRVRAPRRLWHSFLAGEEIGALWPSRLGVSPLYSGSGIPVPRVIDARRRRVCSETEPRWLDCRGSSGGGCHGARAGVLGDGEYGRSGHHP